MIRIGAIIASVFIVASASGQAEMWWALRSSQNAQQREAIRAAVDEFSAKLQAALSMSGDDNATSEPIADVYPTEKTAVEAIVDAFVAQAKASPTFDVHKTRMILGTLPPDQSEVAPLPDGNVGVSGSWSTGGSSGSISQATTAKAQAQAIVFAWSRLRRVMPGARIYAGAMPQTVSPDEMALGIATGEVTQIIQQTNPVVAHGYQGKFVGVCIIGDTTTRYEARFGIQQWADNAPEFLQQQPNKRWMAKRLPDGSSTPALRATRVGRSTEWNCMRALSAYFQGEGSGYLDENFGD